MPQNDMGTAHGRIRLSYEDRATGKLTASLVKISAQMEAMNKRLGNIEKSLKTTDRAFGDAGRSIDRAAKSTRGFSSDIFNAHKGISTFAKDIQSLYQDLNKLQNTFDRFQDMAKPFRMASRGLVELNKSLTDGDSKLKSYSKALSATGIASAVFNKQLIPNLLGAKQAMRDMPIWTQNLYRYSTALAKVGTAGLLISRFSKTDVFSKFLNTKAFAKLAGDSEGAGLAIERFVKRADHSFNFLSRSFNTAFKPIADFAKSSKSFLIGAALINSGINSIVDRFRWLGKIPKPILMALGVTISTILPAALEVFGKALSGASNLLVGLLNGVKQLSGGILVLPGLFATVGAVAASLFPVFAGLKDKFKDVFSDDPSKALAAFYNLPTALQPVATALKDLQPRWKAMKDALQSTAFKGAGEQIKALGETYLPIWSRGAANVIISLRKAKDELVAFAKQGQTQQDVSTIFSNTASTVNSLSKAIQPALAGLRDIAVVGTAFIRDMSAGLPGIVDQFAKWASVNRQNGNLMKWMTDARKGIIDLVKGTWDLTKALWTILTIFKTSTGNNFLSGYADAMDRFNKAVQKSAATGFLRDLANSVKGLGTDKIKAFIDVWHSFVPMFQALMPVIQAISQSFSDIFIPALKFAMQDIKLFAQVLHALGIDRVIGFILGLAAALKVLPSIYGPVISGLKILTGAFLVLGNKGKIISAVESGILAVSLALDKFGPAGKKASAGLLNITGGFSKLIATAAGVVGPITAVLAVFAGGWYAIDQGNKQLQAFNKTLSDAELETVKFKKSLNEAFLQDNGLAGSDVFSVLDQRVTDFMSNLQTQIDAAPGIMAHLGDAFSDIWKGFSGQKAFINWHDVFSDSEAINTAQNVEHQSELVKAGLESLQKAGVDLAATLRGSNADFQKIVDTLKGQGEQGIATAKALSELRAQYQGIAVDIARVGSGSIEVSAGIKKIAEAGHDATQSLQGLRQVLVGLGILKTDAYDAAFQYAEAVRNLGDSIAAAKEQGVDFADALDSTGKAFNTNSEGGKVLYDALKQIGDAFLANVNAGANAQTEYDKFTAQIGDLASETGISKDALIELARQVGLAPKEVAFNVSLKGADQFHQDLAYLIQEAQKNAGTGVAIEIHPQGDPNEFQQKIDTLLGRDAAFAQGTNVVLRPDVTPAEIAKLQAAMAAAGFGMPGGPAPAPAKVAVGNLGDTGKPDEKVGPSAVVPPFVDQYTKGITGALDQLPPAGQDAGTKFVDALASGMDDNPAAIQAAERLAQEIRDRFHHSPPKKGPLASHGDAAVWAGQQFGVSYATGLSQGAPGVASAAAGLGSGAVAGVGGGAKNYQAGKYLGQLSTLVDFAQHAVDAFSKLAETIFSVAKFASDPLGKGTFFGKSLGFQRDPSISDNELAKRNAVAAQNRISSMLSGGSRDLSGYDQTTGMPKIQGPGALQRTSSKSDIIAGIVAQGQAAGLSRDQIQVMIATAANETGGNFNPLANGGVQGPNAAADNVLGLFQEKPGTAGTGNDRTDPNGAIARFIQRYQAALAKNPDPLIASVLAQNPQLGDNAAGSAYAGVTKKYLADAGTELNNALSSGAALSTVTGGIPGIGAVNNLGRTPLLHDQPGHPSQQAAVTAADLIAQIFPEIGNIGGGRADSLPYHDKGRALDVMIPGGSTMGGANPQGKALGDKIKAWALQNASALGIEDTIWQNFWQPPGGVGKTQGNPNDPTQGHFDHIHITFKDGAQADIGPNGTNIKVPTGVPGILPTDAFGPPVDTTTSGSNAPKDLVTRNPDGTFSPATPHLGTDGLPKPPAPINPATGQPWTDQEATDFFNQYPIQYDQSQLKPGDLTTPGVVPQSQDEMLAELTKQTPLLQGILNNGTDGLSTQQAIEAATQLQTQIDQQTALDTPASAVKADALSSIQSDITAKYGLSQQQSPIDQAAGIASGLSSVAGSVFKVIGSGIEAIGAGKDLADMLVRYPSNTEDVMKMIDNIQTFIQFGADVAGAVSSITGAIGGMSPAGMDMGAGAAIKGVSAIAGMVQSALETTNAMIDLYQEYYHIIGSYVGDFLGYLLGGPEGPLSGNMKMLLDTQTNQLLAYSADNPLDKRAHDLLGQTGNPDVRNQAIGQLNYYSGPGRDPRDDTRQMMFMVKTTQMTAPTGQ